MDKGTRGRSFLGTLSLLIALGPMVVSGGAFADAGVHGAGKAAKPIVVNDDPTSGGNETQTGSQTIVAAPSNDTCASPTPLALYRTVKVDSAGANDDYQTPATAACFSGIGQTLTTSPGRDVVYSFTAPAAGSYTFSIVHQDPTAAPLLDGNEVLYVADACPVGGTVNCIKGANRPIQRVLLPSVSGLTNNQSEQVTCVPMGSGQTYYVFFDEGRLNSGGNGAAIEVRDCLSETEPNNAPASANPMACGIGGSSDVPSTAHCHLGFRGGSDPNGILNDGAVCTRSVPLDQSLVESNTKCTISGNACSWDTGTGIDTCLPGEGHCQQLADLDCDPHCTGGPNNGKACATNAFCNPGSAQNATCAGQCLHDATCIVTATGLDTGVQCTSICVGGTFNGRACGAAGGPGILIVTNLAAQVVSDCNGGGGVCTLSAMCPSGQTCGRQFNEGDADFFSLGNVPSGNKIFAGLDAKAANDYDWRMRITTTTATLQFDDDDGVSRNGAGAPEIAGTPGVGTDTFIKVSRTQPRQSEPYLLYSIVRGPLASAQLESEVGPVGNDIYFGWPGDVLNANYVTAGGYVRGLFNGTHGGFVFDSDCFKFLVHEGDLMSWYGDGEPARSAAANTQFPQPVIYDAEPAGISNFIFAANARKNVLTANNTLNGLSPAVTSTFFQWRASYTGMLEVCYYDSSVALGLGTPGNGNWVGSLDVNCGPLQAAGPGTTTTDVSVEKTIIGGTGQAGTFLTYQIKVTNSSSDIAQEVHLHDALDPNVTFVSLGVDDGFPVGATVYAGTIATMGGNTTCVATDGFNFLSGLPTCGVVPADIPIDCINTSMAPGAITTYYLTVQVNNCIGAGIDISNTATISTVSTDPDPSNDASTVSITTTDDGSCQSLFQDPTSNTCYIDRCFKIGTCNSGVCQAVGQFCDDNNVCTEDSCDPAVGCINDDTGNGCYSDFNDCTFDQCDPILGCIFPPAPYGYPCNDGFACTPTDICDGNGSCGGSFCDDGNPCTDDFADLPNGCACSHAPSFPGTPCDDGNACTGDNYGSYDSCDGAGTCVGGAPPNIDDANACTIDSCDPETGAVYVPVECDDGNACNGLETCNPTSGCVPGTPPDCNDNNVCNGVETCDPVYGCIPGIPPYIDDANACTIDSCDPETGAVYVPVECDDGNACNGVENCNPTSGCVPGTPPVCNDNNACNGYETCDPEDGCVAGTPLQCDDFNVCNGPESCDPVTACVAGTPLSCDDGNACNGAETCNPASGCVGGTPVTCAPPDQCRTAGVCDPGTGLCGYGNQPNGTTCDDGNSGTSGDSCQNGACVGSGCNSSNDPKTKGWYKSLCHNAHSGDSLTDADAACVGAGSTRFAGMTTVAQLCAVYDSSHQTNCDRADEELLTLELNICKQRVCPAQSIDSDCGNNGTVAQSENEADTLLSNPSRSNAQCSHAECLSKEISNGHALELNTLAIRREVGNVRLSWQAPLLDDGTGQPRGYKIWRRAIGSTAPFVLIGTTNSTPTYLDTTAGSGSWQYDVTPTY